MEEVIKDLVPEEEITNESIDADDIQECTLELEEEDAPVISEEEGNAAAGIISEYVSEAVEQEEEKITDWLSEKMQKSLPEKPQETVRNWAEEIVNTIKNNNENLKSLREIESKGQSREGWFSGIVQRAFSGAAVSVAAERINSFQNALNAGKDAFLRTVEVRSKQINMNPNLDGFIAEQHHAATFNLNAAEKGSIYRARVRMPDGNAYGKNSVDLEVYIPGKPGVRDKVVARYQSKYCKTPEATAKAFERGDYRGQRKLVPDGQEKLIGKKASNVIESPDGIKSEPLSKAKAQEIRDELQKNGLHPTELNNFTLKKAAVNIARQAGKAALISAAFAGVGVGFRAAKRALNGEKVKGSDVVKEMFNEAGKAGADTTVKVAAAGALKVAAEKGLISCLPKGTPAGAIANIAYVGIEDAKILYKMAKNELSASEGIKAIEETTVSVAAGLIAAGKGAAIGAEAGLLFGPVGAAVGGLVGGAVGYCAGETVGKAVVAGCRKVREVAAEKISSAVSTVKTAASKVFSGFKALFA